MTPEAMRESSLPLPLFRRGKVREVYEVDADTLLLVASDRVSAFDVVMNEAIPRKGAVLTQTSAFWFRELAGVVPSHFLTADADEIVRRIPPLQAHKATIAGRSMLVRRTEPVLFECVVRGYLSGSAWKEYRQHGTLAGEELPAGLVESQKLDPPIFSPATKAESGHDENITLLARGIIIADTKFEFGQTADGTLLVIDEVLTPDSSRFWPADSYEPGQGQPSFDKQPLRDFLDGLKREGAWDGNPPPPPLPPDVVEATSTRYQAAYRLVTGQELPSDQ
jgi:phosphoribosylaminoimidazole-succinocarboxamide synthase